MRKTEIRFAMFAVFAVAAAARALADEPPAPMPPLSPPAARSMGAASEAPRAPDAIPEPGLAPEHAAPALPPPPVPQVGAAGNPVPESSASAAPCPQQCCRPGCGCRRECDPEQPFGASLRAALAAQTCNGIKARMVLYQYDFCDSTACDGYKLSPKGVLRLLEVARMLPTTNFHPITIEASFQNPQLDAARRGYVLRTLSQLNIPVPEQLVVVGAPLSSPINGQDALLMHKNVLEATKNGEAKLRNEDGAAGGSGGSNTGTGSGGSGAGGSQSQ